MLSGKTYRLTSPIYVGLATIQVQEWVTQLIMRQNAPLAPVTKRDLITDDHANSGLQIWRGANSPNGRFEDLQLWCV